MFTASVEAIVLIWSVWSVELTLAWNSVTNIYSIAATGQLIPFIAGMLGFLRNLHLVIVDMHKIVCLMFQSFLLIS